MRISIIIGAPSTLAIDLLRRAFYQRRKHFKVVAGARTRKELLTQVAKHQAEVILIRTELENHPTGGLQALRELRLTRSSARAILLFDRWDPEIVVQAFLHGARGAFCMSEDFATLCKCIRSVHAGQFWSGSTQLQWVLRAFQKRGMVRLISAKGIPLLTQREEKIVRSIAEGLPSSEICTALGLSPHTVKNHLFNIYKKLGISNRAELQLYISGSRDTAPGGDNPSTGSPTQLKQTQPGTHPRTSPSR